MATLNHDFRKIANDLFFSEAPAGVISPSGHRVSRARSVEDWDLVRPQSTPTGDADDGWAQMGVVVVHRGSASTWPKGPQPPLDRRPTTCTGTRSCWNRPTPMSGGTPNHCYRTVELRLEQRQAL